MTSNDGMEHISDIMIRTLDDMLREAKISTELARRASEGDMDARAQLDARLRRKAADNGRSE